MASTDPAFPSNLSILGGIPLKHQDLGASIIFAFAYLLLLPLVLFRVISPRSRCMQLIRPSIFVVIRIGTFVARSIIANGNYAERYFVVEQILLLCGFILLCEPLVALAKFHVLRNHSADDGETNLLQKVLRLLQLALVIAVILGVVAGTKYGDLNNAATLATVKNYRDANGAICLAVSIIAGALVLYGAATESLPATQTFFLLVISALLTTVSVVKLCIYLITPTMSPIHAGTKAIFYLLVSLPEIIVCTLYLSQNLNDAFEIPEAKEKAWFAKKGVKQGYAGGAEQQATYPPASYPDGSYPSEYSQNQTSDHGEKARNVARHLPIVRHFV